MPESWGGRFGSTSVSKNRLWSSRFQIPRLAPDFGELDSFQKPAQAIQNPDSAPRRGFWNLDRFQDPDIAMQNPDYAPRPAIWKLKDKIQIPNSETAVSVYAPALMPHPFVIVVISDVHRRSDAFTHTRATNRGGAFGLTVSACGGRGRRAGRALGGRARESATPTGDRVGIPLSSGCFPPSPTAPTRRTHIHIDRDTPGKTLGHRPPGDPSAHGSIGPRRDLPGDPSARRCLCGMVGQLKRVPLSNRSRARPRGRRLRRRLRRQRDG